MGGLDGWVSWYYGRWPQYAALSGCVALLVLGNGHPVLQVTAVALLPVAVLAPAAMQIAATFTGQSDDHEDDAQP